MLRWDGTYIGSLHKDDILEINKWNDFKLYRIKLNEQLFLDCVCHSSTGNSSDSCICDELKPLFGLQKIGTHWMRFGKSQTVLVLYNPVSFYNYTLLMKPIPDIYQEEIRRILIFRYICSISNISEKNIIILNNRPLSTKEGKMIFDMQDATSHFCTKTHELFNRTTYGRVTCQMLKVHNVEELNIFMTRFSSQVDEVFQRVDGLAIHKITPIIGRVFSLLTSGLG